MFCLRFLKYFSIALCIFVASSPALAIEDHASIPTPWAEEVSQELPHNYYPRPQMVRSNWTNLNGQWDYAIRPKAEADAPQYEGKILVPFPAESALSNVEREVGADNKLHYRRTFESPQRDESERVLLHFGAVDWQATVFVNDEKVGQHEGGFDPFYFDITDALSEGENELRVVVWDPTDSGPQPIGKQRDNPEGIWYTAVTGIWQTVWLERVPKAHIKSLDIRPDLQGKELQVVVNAANADSEQVQVEFVSNGSVLATGAGATGDAITIRVPEVEAWSPDNPKLYDLRISLSSGDRVESYCGFRTIEIGKAADGITRLLLNGEALFQYGPLDQGWWPDGLYTAPTEEALRYDLEITQQLGFNMVRKHVKVEPARWYEMCDRMGLIVWQDMPNGDKHIGPNDPDIQRTRESGEIYERELKAMIHALDNHPSIVMWVPYNEGWGQWDTARITDYARQLDPTRIINAASGWTDRGTGDVHDIHNYPAPSMPPVEEKRAVVLGEFGGLGLPLKGHTWQSADNWGYKSYENKQDLEAAYRVLVGQLRLLIGEGLSAAVYTQTTDVEVEVNGLMTYDRRVLKLPMELAKLHKKLYEPAPRTQTVIPTSRELPRTWRYTTTEPELNWKETGFDDSDWETGEAPFGNHQVPNVRPNTAWETEEIWLRTTWELDAADLQDSYLKIYHDEDAEVYLNGVKATSLSGHTTNYVAIPVAEAARAALSGRQVTVAVHCRQTHGGQLIDVGLIDVKPRE